MFSGGGIAAANTALHAPLLRLLGEAAQEVPPVGVDPRAVAV
jgi:hypothetical protein